MKHPLAFALIMTLAALFLSCNEGTNTLFENIVNDTAVNNNNQLGDKSNVPSMTKIGTTYYATVGVIRYRDETETVWHRLVLASDTDIHNTVATDGTHLYAGVYIEGSTGKLYQYDPGTTTKTDMDTTALNSSYISKIKNFGSTPPYNVYAAYKKHDETPSSYGTFSICSISGTTATGIPGIDALGLADSINDLAYDGTNLYLVSGKKVYRGTTEITPDSAYTYTGVYYDTANTRLLVSTNDGYIYRSADPIGNDWTDGRSAYHDFSSGTSTYPVRFSEIVSLSSNLYLVGSHGAGFWTIDGTTTPVTVTRWNGSSYSELYNGSIESIFIDTSLAPDPDRVFFCTSGAGLWDNTYATSWGDTWTRE